MKVLCLVAHPDDESLFCGGSLAKHAKAGDDVRVVSFADGESARGFKPGAIDMRWRQFEAACAILGAEPIRRCRFPDQQSDMVSQLEINQAIEYEIAAYGPHLVFSHFHGDLNLDHRRIAEAAVIATRMGPELRMMRPEFPARCIGMQWWTNRQEDIVPTLETKIAACRCYAGELRDYPHPRSEAALRMQSYEEFAVIVP